MLGLMKRNLSTLKAAGLRARRVRRGVYAAQGLNGSWYIISEAMWAAMAAEGVLPAFRRFTLLGDLFSVPWRG